MRDQFFDAVRGPTVIEAAANFSDRTEGGTL